MRTQLMVSLALIAVLAGGCSTKKTVYGANGTSVTTDNGDKTVTVQASGETLTMGENAVDLSKLGIPIYPGAKQTKGGYSVSGAGANGSGMMTALTTSDSFDQVYAWYKSHLPAGSEKVKLTTGGASMASFVIGNANGSGEQTGIYISQKGSETNILLSKGTNTTH